MAISHESFITEAFRRSIDADRPAVVEVTGTPIYVQGGLTEQGLYLEVSDLEHWETGEITEEQVKRLAELGFRERKGNFSQRLRAGDDPAELAGRLLTQVLHEVFRIHPSASLN